MSSDPTPTPDPTPPPAPPSLADILEAELQDVLAKNASLMTASASADQANAALDAVQAKAAADVAAAQAQAASDVASAQSTQSAAVAAKNQAHQDLTDSISTLEAKIESLK